MPLPLRQCAAITFVERFTDDDSQTILGTWTGEIDTWGKYTIRPLDRRAPVYYLFADEVTEVHPLNGAELAEAIDAIWTARRAKAAELRRQARALLQGQRRRRVQSARARA